MAGYLCMGGRLVAPAGATYALPHYCCMPKLKPPAGAAAPKPCGAPNAYVPAEEGGVQ